MKSKKKLNVRNIFLILLLTIFSFQFIIITNALSDISVSLYCQLSIQSMQLEVNHLNDLITIMNQNQDDPEIQAQQIGAKQAEYDQVLTSFYASFNTTGNEYVMYLGKYDNEVTAYLEANSDIKQQMDTLTSQIETLLAQYESLKDYERELPEEPPLP